MNRHVNLSRASEMISLENLQIEHGMVGYCEVHELVRGNILFGRGTDKITIDDICIIEFVEAITRHFILAHCIHQTDETENLRVIYLDSTDRVFTLEKYGSYMVLKPKGIDSILLNVSLPQYFDHLSLPLQKISNFLKKEKYDLRHWAGFDNLTLSKAYYQML